MAKANTPFHIVWRPMAGRDLGNIIDYIARDNPTKADAFVQLLRARTQLLAQHPELGRTGRPDLPGFLRERVVHRNHLVFYRVLADIRTVEIVSVKHVARKLP